MNIDTCHLVYIRRRVLECTWRRQRRRRVCLSVTRRLFARFLFFLFFCFVRPSFDSLFLLLLKSLWLRLSSCVCVCVCVCEAHIIELSSSSVRVQFTSCSSECKHTLLREDKGQDLFLLCRVSVWRRLNLPFTGAIVFCAQFVCCFIVVCVVPSICLSSSVCLSVFAESREYNRLFILSFRCFSFFHFGLVFAHSVCLCVFVTLCKHPIAHTGLDFAGCLGERGKVQSAAAIELYLSCLVLLLLLFFGVVKKRNAKSPVNWDNCCFPSLTFTSTRAAAITSAAAASAAAVEHQTRP